MRAEGAGRCTAAGAAGVRAQLPAGEGREDRMASFKLKSCLRFQAGWRSPPPSRRQFHPLWRTLPPWLASAPRCFFPKGASGVGAWEFPLVAGPGWGGCVAPGWGRLGPGGSCGAPPGVWARDTRRCHAGPQTLRVTS